MIVYALGAYLNGVPVYFSGINESTPQFTSEVEEAEFGNESDVLRLKQLFEKKALNLDHMKL
ncbi:hypothetical protein ACFC37_06710 [Enterococcus durans]|uniref:hypothetical protein n=1 Tax=Enterococcus durans TaxID=53345 RepID=UPI0039A40284